MVTTYSNPPPSLLRIVSIAASNNNVVVTWLHPHRRQSRHGSRTTLRWANTARSSARIAY